MRDRLRHLRTRVAGPPKRPEPPTEPPNPLLPLVAAFADAHPAATFVQIGSNDGEGWDPLRAAILAHRWTGVMVEPVPYVFERLERNYGHVPGITLERVAVADVEGTRDLYYLPESADEGLWQWYDALASFHKDVLLKHTHLIPDIAERVAVIEVRCVTFDSLCERNGLTAIDAIQIDTEGYDFEIIKEIDLDRYRPGFVMFEHLHLDEATRRTCRTHFRRHGYDDLSNGMDTLCLRMDGGRDDEPVRDLFRQLKAEAHWHLVDDT